VRGDPLLGTAVDVTDDGALLVRDDAGTDHTVATADVIHLR
jgi:BirA family biotin operon repressor/biotin-[acetyl-CoA-carboxylase] ligase